MTYRVLDTVVLDRDIPESGLRRGDLGAVVEVYQPDAFSDTLRETSRKSLIWCAWQESNLRPSD